MAHNKSEDNSFRDLVARLNAMSNITPEKERASLMESVGKAPKVLDDKEVSLIGVEAKDSAALSFGSVGIMQGFKSEMLQTPDGSATLPTSSLASGINFYSAGVYNVCIYFIFVIILFITWSTVLL